MPSLGDHLIRSTAGIEARLRAWVAVFRFGAAAARVVFSRSTYNNATREVVAKQIYFTAWQILPGFAAFAAVLSLVVTQILAESARNYGLYEYALELAVRAWVLEAVPLLTALFVALRTGAAISTEVALMRIRNELGAMREMGIDPMRLELAPRVIGGTISVLALTAVSLAVSLLCADLVVTDYQPWLARDAELERVLARVLDPLAMIVLWVKVFAFGLAVTVIPVAVALTTPRHMYQAPIAVLNGMVRLFFALMLIEVTALVVQYL